MNLLRNKVMHDTNRPDNPMDKGLTVYVQPG